MSTAGSSFDTVLAVYLGPALASLTPVISDDDSGSNSTSRVNFRAIAGETYYIAVDGFQGATGNIRLAIAPIGYAAPSWQVSDISNQVVRSTDFTNKVMLVDFWETTCGACVEEIPYLIQLQDRYRNDGFAIVGCYENSGTALEVAYFATYNHMDYTIIAAPKEVKAALGGVLGYPTKYLIDRENNVVGQLLGGHDLAFYEALIGPYLRGAAQVRVDARKGAGPLTLAWPGSEFGYVLESSSNLVSGGWSPVSSPVQLSNGQHTVTLPNSATKQFYRLSKTQGTGD
jgi:thiol-disulfide isomerase/thioredoxin